MYSFYVFQGNVHLYGRTSKRNECRSHEAVLCGLFCPREPNKPTLLQFSAPFRQRKFVFDYRVTTGVLLIKHVVPLDGSQEELGFVAIRLGLGAKRTIHRNFFQVYQDRPISSFSSRILGAIARGRIRGHVKNIAYESCPVGMRMTVSFLVYKVFLFKYLLFVHIF